MPFVVGATALPSALVVMLAPFLAATLIAPLDSTEVEIMSLSPFTVNVPSFYS